MTAAPLKEPMNHTTFFDRHSDEHGRLSLIPFCPDSHSAILHRWVSQPYAAFWGMLDKTEAEVKEEYYKLCDTPRTRVYLGLHNDRPAFLVETYAVEDSPLARHYSVQSGDIGMHILLAPPRHPIPHFSHAVLSAVMDFIFEHPDNLRVVVEPDHRNDKIHRLNKRVGFFHQQRVQLADKETYLAFCTREQFAMAKAREDRVNEPHTLPHYDPYRSTCGNALTTAPGIASESIDSETWAKVNRQLVQKALSELCHERILDPRCVDTTALWCNYRLSTDSGDVEYRFTAQRLPLNHWQIDLYSIERMESGRSHELDAIDFIVDFQGSLGIDSSRLASYLEEVTSTLCSSAYKQQRPWQSAKYLACADFQSVETGMTEGHPCFIANNGRIGFSAADFRAYAPEAAAPVTLMWLAAHKQRAHFSVGPDLDYQQLLSEELDLSTRNRFTQTLVERGVEPDDYLWIPIHPWQWLNKLSNIYAPEIASNHLILLGYGDDAYLAQQSIRTFYNISQPNKRYVKTALSILNMGFMRGLSAYYMRSTPAINQWLRELIDNDAYLQSKGFDMLREIAAVGYEIPHYDKQRIGDNPYRKMLAALWRENPHSRLKPDQRLMTMASLLHVDPAGEALLPALIEASGLSIDDWLARYFDVYLTPLLHCFYQHELAFMPHGENLILVFDNNIPVRAIMKDIGEEIVLQNSRQPLPEDVERIKVDVPEEMEVLAIFTDVFDCFFRFMSATLYQHADYPVEDFWRGVGHCIRDYQHDNPQLAARFEQHDLFADEFALSCLNRLQLRNNQQMVDLTDPANSLCFAGTLNNPVAPYRPSLQLDSDHLRSREE
ncbi:siderophore synthetase component [Sinobacterium caligoides]|uniref:Siderophore synthetase component n=1 Tax=Sinobacterium caligoides TaxID=933926 RepID=A0A3N2DKA9_9GAMM|nr:GNAT family N-acetyltransferase [Sinobacterium caligoides]ROS00240.1 siderophore synthetase component [Sinobacterium caligoides]